MPARNLFREQALDHQKSEMLGDAARVNYIQRNGEVVAHRPLTIAMAGRIFVLKNRKLVERSGKNLSKGSG